MAEILQHQTTELKRTQQINNALSTINALNPIVYQKHPNFLVPEGVEDADLTGLIILQR
jgi:hypothetical protein